MNPEETMRARLEQASLWWLRLREADVPAEELGRWLDWCQLDPANLRAFEKIVGLGNCFNRLDAQGRVDLVREFMSETGPERSTVTSS